MSVFNNGGGDIKASTKPGALLELFWYLDEAEKAQQENLGLAKKTAWTADLGNQTVTFTATNLPMKNIINSAGRPEMMQQNYLGGTLGNFNPGNGGDLLSTDIPSAFVEMATKISDDELLILTTTATQTPHTTSVVYNTDAKTCTVTSTLPISTTQNATTGGIELEAIDFLP